MIHRAPAPTPPATLGRALRDARERAGLTREQVAVETLRTVSTIFKWESDTHPPPLAVVQRLATVLDAPELLELAKR